MDALAQAPWKHLHALSFCPDYRTAFSAFAKSTKLINCHSFVAHSLAWPPVRRLICSGAVLSVPPTPTRRSIIAWHRDGLSLRKRYTVYRAQNRVTDDGKDQTFTSKQQRIFSFFPFLRFPRRSSASLAPLFVLLSFCFVCLTGRCSMQMNARAERDRARVNHKHAEKS